jgi:hypothetical protein
LVAGVHAVERWHESQERDVTKWLAGLPLALAPAWHVAQVPGATPVCEKFAGVHAVVRWQESQDNCVGKCLPGLAEAELPL